MRRSSVLRTYDVTKGFEKFITFPARQPRVTLCALGVLGLVAALAVTRLRPDPSLESMFNRNDPAAAALVRVMNDFSAADELLVLAVVPERLTSKEVPEASAGRLVAFARRLEAAVAASPALAGAADGVAYQADPEMRRFAEQVLVPNGIFYLDEATFAEARKRLTREEMRRQVEQNAAVLAQPGPAAQALSKVLLKDPLRLHEFVMDRLTGSRGSFRTFGGGGQFVSPDGRAILVRVKGRRPPSDLEFSRQFTAAVNGAADSVNSEGLELKLSGSYAIAAASEKAIRRDMTASITSSVVFLAALFLVASRRPHRMFTFSFLPVAFGSLLGFGAYALLFPTLTPLTGAVGAILAGMGIDYSINFLSYFDARRSEGAQPREAAVMTVVQLGPAMFGAFVTSIIGFVAIGWSDVGVLRDFAVLGSLGLAGSFVGAVVALPAVMAMMGRRKVLPLSPVLRGEGERRSGPRINLAPLAAWVARRGGWAVAASGFVLAAALAVVLTGRGDVLPLESDLTVMHPRPNPALDAQGEIARRFGVAPSSLLVHLKADSPERLLALAHRARERLDSADVRRAGIAGTLGLETLLPDPALAASRAAAIRPGEPRRVADDFRAVIADSPFDAKAYEPYAEFLEHLLSRREAPEIGALLKFPNLARSVLPNSALAGKPATEALTLVFLSDNADDRATRNAVVGAARSALAELPGATLTGMTVLSHSTEAQVRRELPRLVLAALGLVVVYLLLHFRSVGEALFSVLPAAFSLVLLLAVMRLTGRKLNLINLVSLPLLVGIDVDYGIFLVSLRRAARLGAGAGETASERLEKLFETGSYALFMCAATTVLGFGSLVTTSVPAVQSLGLVVGVGVAGCLYATLLLLAPLLLWRGRRGGIRQTAGAQLPAAATGAS